MIRYSLVISWLYGKKNYIPKRRIRTYSFLIEQLSRNTVNVFAVNSIHNQYCFLDRGTIHLIH